ncbi:hypothetical protein COCVIDRAFT_114755, partial [Bipolaris victoriae FI3]
PNLHAYPCLVSLLKGRLRVANKNDCSIHGAESFLRNRVFEECNLTMKRK